MNPQQNTGGFQAAWTAYLCAMHGHAWTWNAYRSNGPPPRGYVCSRCGAVKSA